MVDNIENTLDRFSKSFTAVMHIFHNLSSEVCHVADLSLAQYRVLMMVYHYGPMSINDLKRHLNIAQSSASEMVHRLEQSGLISREKAQHDRRVTLFKLTDKTYAIFKKNKALMQTVYQDVLTPLTLQEQEDLIRAFEIISRLMRQEKGK